MTTQADGIKFKFTPPAPVREVSWQTIFTPKGEQLSRFMLLWRAITPYEVRLFFDPFSHFLWKEQNINGHISWMVADIPCRPPKAAIPQIERAIQHLHGINPTCDTTEGLRKKVQLALALLLELGR